MESGPAQSDETEQETSLELYKAQLSQVDQAIQAAGMSEDLGKLKSDLEELIKLTEDNLLELKRARLLKMLGPSVGEDDSDDEEDDKAAKAGGDGGKTANAVTVDDEYAAFQAAIAESSNPSEDLRKENSSSPMRYTNKTNETRKSTTQSLAHQKRLGKNDNKINNSDDNKEEERENESYSQVQSSMLDLVGTKCRAPFSQEWGDHHYGNAMILAVDDPDTVDSMDDCVVHVIFINPIHQSMVPCSYYMEGKCRFSPQDCRSSHGYPVKVSQLHPYLEPDYRKLTEGCRCLAKPDGDNVWYQGVVVDVYSDTELNVKLESTKEEELVPVENVIPLENDDDTESDSDSSEDDPSNSQAIKKTPLESSEDEDNAMPVYLWKPLQTTERLGAWETHTKGIGSKLMAKMGYITGQGLGRYGDGRAEPVPILLLPQGKSLDKIMELKEMAGNADLFNAMKTLERRQKAMEKKQMEKEKRGKGQTNWGVFGFLNQHLGKEAKGGHRHAPLSSNQPSSSSSSSLLSSSSSESPSSSAMAQAKHSSVRDLSQRSDTEVNVQIFKTAEAIRGVERNLNHLKRQLARNESKDRKVADNIRQKIEQEESHLRKLKNSSQTLESHKERRKAHKKLTIF